MAVLPDDVLVVRGGKNLPESFAQGSGVTIDDDGKLDNVSVHSAAGATIEQLTPPNATTGYIGIKHNQIGVTTVGEIRRAGGDVVPSETKKNPNHATLKGLSPEQASELFRPTQMNPSAPTK
jgi:hypothetical protein